MKFLILRNIVVIMDLRDIICMNVSWIELDWNMFK